MATRKAADHRGTYYVCSHLGLVGWESYRNTERVAEVAAARRNSLEVRILLDEATARLIDAETGQRGYLLTGDEAYLETYDGIRTLNAQ